MSWGIWVWVFAFLGALLGWEFINGDWVGFLTTMTIWVLLLSIRAELSERKNDARKREDD